VRVRVRACLCMPVRVGELATSVTRSSSPGRNLWLVWIVACRPTSLTLRCRLCRSLQDGRHAYVSLRRHFVVDADKETSTKGRNCEQNT